MPDTTLSIGITAELAEFRRKMAEMPAIGEAEARDMVTGIRAQLKKAEDAAKASAKATAKAATDAAKASAQGSADAAKGVSSAFSSEYNKVISGAAALSSQVGGSFGRIGSTISSAIRPLTEAGVEFGVAGLAAAEIGLAVYGIRAVVGGALDLAESASTAATELETMGYAVDAGHQADLARYAEGTRDLKVSLDQLKVAAGAGVASEVGVLSRALSDQLDPAVVNSARSWNSWGDALVDRIPGVAATRDLIRYGEKSLYSAFTDTARAELDAETNLDGLNNGLEATQRLIDQIRGDYGPTLEQLLGKGTSPNKTTADAAAAAKAAAAAASEEAKQTRAAMLAQNEAAQASTKAVVEQRVEVAIAGQYWDNLSTKVRASATDATAAIKKIGDSVQKNYINALRTAQADTYVSLVPGILDSIGSIDQAVIDSYQTQINAGKQLTTAQIEAGNAAIRGQEIVSIAQAGISATLAGIGTYTSLVAELVPAPAAAVTAGLVTSLSYASAVAGIEAHRPAFFSYPHTASFGGKGDTAQALVDTNGNGKADTAAAVAVKGGSIGEAGDDAGSTRPQNGKGSTSRTRHGDVSVEVRVRGTRAGHAGHGRRH